MKKQYLCTILFCAIVGFIRAQDVYWVFFTDKNNTTFDPYSYFDPKAIERYGVHHADLYDITNYPVNVEYETQVAAIVTENVGTSRWLNAMGVVATEEQITKVQGLHFVAAVQPIVSEALPASNAVLQQATAQDGELDQVSLMQGSKFQQRGINGKGVRIAVFDGGFPDVDKHPAFQHLRDNHQIVKTWNFANKKENVYGYNTHGRMVLSCIAGIMNGTTMMGLAPGAEFLLARTEVEAEKKKEEIWWVQALEWADQNGASIVNSSLGYGKELHSLKDMDGKTSIVARGAATAAGKGILVCTAMGNEGAEREWMMLVTPADADSVLSVGAVSSLEERELYSSFGPTADGRRKPNVVACGYSLVASSKGNYSYASGTSFATPMVAGFAACVRQMHPEWTAIQLLEEIEKSANHYPYFDYAFGYGVPQAGYFTDGPKESKHSFDLQEDEDNLYIVPVTPNQAHKLFYNVQNGDGSLHNFKAKRFDADTLVKAGCYSIKKKSLLPGQTVNIWYDDQYAQYVVGADKLAAADTSLVLYSRIKYDYMGSNQRFSYHKKIPYSWGLAFNVAFMLPSIWAPTGNNYLTDRISPTFFFCFTNNWQVARVYGLGARIGFGSSWYALKANTDPMGLWNQHDPVPESAIRMHNLKTFQFDLEFTQRFVLAHISHSQLYIEAGLFGDWITGSQLKTKIEVDGVKYKEVHKKYFRDGMYKLDCGVRLRFGLAKWFAIYGQYRITPILKTGVDLPKWEIGMQFF